MGARPHRFLISCAALACVATGTVACGTGDGPAPSAPVAPPVSAFRFRTDARVRHDIPLDRIVKGIPRADPKDGIPAIRSPEHVPAAEAAWVRDGDAVVGVEVGGEARAYSIRQLDRHEVVNDVLGGVPIAVTYCPLCDSAVVARRDPDLDPARDGETLTLGVSGYLFDSDVLLYDAETETFWQQIEARAVVGPHTGRRLERLESVRTSWSRWRAAKPRTTVLSFRTEYGWPSPAYEEDPYAEYRASRRLRFPVERFGSELPPKAQVYGLSHEGRHLAVPEAALDGREGPLEVAVGGRSFRLVREPHLGTWRATAPRAGAAGSPPGDDPVPLLRCYWFAWSAFHPGTEVWEPSRR
jgi:hypothetical protein